jgi:hypothetical protein
MLISFASESLLVDGRDSIQSETAQEAKQFDSPICQEPKRNREETESFVRIRIAINRQGVDDTVQ